MKAKKCSKCNEFMYVEYFSKSSKNKDGYHSWCKVCVAEYDSKRYSRPEIKAKVRETSRKILNRNKKFVEAILNESECVDCGENDNIVLEFDHVRGTKLFNIADGKHHGYSIENLQKEIDKCEVRCANCHRRKTHKRRIA